MSWPLITDFSRMLQNPRVAFRDPELRDCQIELNSLGQPKARSGNFATVYKAFKPDGSEFAVRVFNRRAEERRERYQLVSEYIKERHLSCLVGFKYDEQGIRSGGDGQLYPLLLMDWVPGVTLFEWIRDRCREGYREALAIGAEAWLHLVHELEQHDIDHGDLQHGNVLVSIEGHFKLVDYDCMSVPALIGRPNLEIGLPPYQHPERGVNTLLYRGLDNYSSLMIYVALRALAVAPHLWFTYVDQPGYDKVLFRSEDFANPQQSRLYHDLLQSPDEQVRDLAHYLFQLASYKIEDVPRIDEVLLWCHRLEDLLAARDWDLAVELSNRISANEPIAAEIQTQLNFATQRVQARKDAELAYENGDETKLQQIFESGLLHDYPKANDILHKAGRAAEVANLIRTMNSAVQLQSWDMLRSTWQASQQLIANRPSAKTLKQEMQKLVTIDNLQRQLASERQRDDAVLEAWDFLQKGGGHPMAEPLRPEIERRRVRWNNVLILKKCIDATTQKMDREADRKIVAAWVAEQMENWHAIQVEAEAYQQAKQRLELLNQVVTASQNSSLESEKLIGHASKVLPKQYVEKLANRFNLAGKRLKEIEIIERALTRPISEAAVVDAWTRLDEVKGTSVASEEMKNRVELARQRLEIIQKLRQLPPDMPQNDLEKQIIKLWDESVLDGCADVARWEVIYNKVVGSQKWVDRIHRKIKAKDVDALRRIVTSVAGQQFENMPSEVSQALTEASEFLRQQEVGRSKALANAITGGNGAPFRELFDLPMLREICEQAKHHQPVVARMIEAHILPLESLGLAQLEEGSLVKEEEAENHWRVKWQVPDPKFETRTELRVCSKMPKSHTIPDDVKAVHSMTFDDANRVPSEDGYLLAVEPEWDGHWIAVWAVIDLGFQTFHSPTLVIGQLQLGEKKRGWKLFGS
jgi:hypothetical protein